MLKLWKYLSLFFNLSCWLGNINTAYTLTDCIIKRKSPNAAEYSRSLWFDVWIVNIWLLKWCLSPYLHNLSVYRARPVTLVRWLKSISIMSRFPVCLPPTSEQSVLGVVSHQQFLLLMSCCSDWQLDQRPSREAAERNTGVRLERLGQFQTDSASALTP